MTLRVACVGGGPGGLFLAVLLKQADPKIAVTLFERNRPTDTFGFGVVFSDATLGALGAADTLLTQALVDSGRHWDRIEVRLKGTRVSCGGNGMAAITRKDLLRLLQERAEQLGVDLRYGTEVPNAAALADYDVVVAADGANSRLRDELADHVGPQVEVAAAKFIWLGTSYMFDGLTFVHERGEHGVFAVHGYPIDAGTSTFIVETDEDTWREAGLDAFDVRQPPGPSDERSRRYLEELFGPACGGAPLLVNNSRWGNFRTRRLERWHAGNVVFLGDAAHTAHFSVGSGTKMAMEDAVALAAALLDEPGAPADAFARYEAERRPDVERIQQAARPSLSWWEHFGRYHDAFDPAQFAFHFLSRSIGRAKLAKRDPDFVAAADSWWAHAHGGAEPLDTPLAAGATRLEQRLLDQAPTGPGIVSVIAPTTEADLPAAFDALAPGAELVVVRGGTRVTRSLLSEEARLGRGLSTVIVDPETDVDRAWTLVLSGRADAVARA